MVLSVVNSGTVSGSLIMGTSATGTGGQFTITTSLPTPPNCNGLTITGTNIHSGATVVSGQGTTNLLLSAANDGTVSGIITMALTVTAASGNLSQYTITTTTAVPSYCIGWQIAGTGIATGATIVSGQGTSSLTLSIANTASVTGTLTLTYQPDSTSRYFIDAFEAGTVSTIVPPAPALATTATAIAGVYNTPNVTLSSNSPANCYNWYVFGSGITLGTQVLSGQGTKNLVLSNNNLAGGVSGILILSPTNVQVTAAATCTINTYTLALSGSSPANCNGWYIAGAGVGFGATIVSGQNTSTLTVSMLNTATFSSGTLYLCPTAPVPNIFSYPFTGSSGANPITTSPNTTITPYNCNGWYVSGTGIADGCIVTGGQGTNQLTLSASNTGSVSGVITLSPTIATATAASGTAGTFTMTTAASVPANCNGWYISGTGIAQGATIVSGQGGTTLKLSLANTATVSGALTLSATTISTGSIIGQVFTAGTTTGAYYPGQILMGSNIHSPVAIVSPSGACYTTTAVTTVNFAAGNPLQMGIKPGMTVNLVNGTTGAIALALACHVAYTAGSVTANTVVLSVAPGTTLGAATLQFGPTYTSDTGVTSQGELLTLATGTTANLVVGMFVSVVGGGAIPAGAYITQILSTTTFTISQIPTTQLTGGANFIIFTQYQTMISNQVSGVPGGAGTYNIWPPQGMYGVGGQINTGTGNSNSTSLTLLSNSPAACNGWSITGPGIAVGATISSGQGTTSLVLSTNNTAAVSGTVTLAPVVTSYPIISMGGSILTDSLKNWPLNRWNNQVVRIKAGIANGDYRSILATVPGYTTYTSAATSASSSGTLVTLGSGSTSGLTVGMVVTVTTAATTGVFAFGTTVTAINSATQFTVSTAPTTALASATVVAAPVNTLVTYPGWNTTPDTTSRYVIHGDPDKIYMSFGGQTPTFVHNIEADTVTLGRMLDYGAARGTSAQYADQPPVALNAATPAVPVLPITGSVGYVASSTVSAGSVTSGITTITHNGGTFPVGSWIIVASVSPVTYNGTWQVTNSTTGSVSYYNASGSYVSGGTVLQTNSITLGGNLASGAFASFGNGTTMTLSGCVPSAYNGTWTVAAGLAGTPTQSCGGYQSNTGVTCVNATGVFTVTSAVGLRIGQIPTITADPGTFAFAAGTVITAVGAGQFTVSPNPSGTLGASAVVSVIPSVAWVGTIPGNMTTLGVVQKVPQVASVAVRTSWPTVTLTTSLTIFPVGSWITVYGITPGYYNGVFQVTASSAGSVSYIGTVDPVNAGSVFAGGIGIASPMLLVTTVNPHSFKAGQYVTHRGDTGFSAANNNITAPITPILQFSGSTPFPAIASSLYTYPTAVPTGPMVNFPAVITLAHTLLCDSAKNWLPNQWAGCTVTYNSTQSGAAATQAAVASAYISSNTSNTLIMANIQTGYAPVTGISRYVITAPANAPVQNTLGSSDSGLALGVQTTSLLQDVTQGWVSPGGTTAVFVIIPVTTAVNCTPNSPLAAANLYVGMTGIILYSASASTLAASSTIASVTPTNIAMSGNFTTIGTAVMLFGYGVASAPNSGNTVTLTLVLGLFVGMTAAVSTGTVTLPTNTTITAINAGTLVVTLSQNFSGTAGNAAILSFTAPCSSSGNVVTVAGFTTAGLGVGMYVGVLSAGNLSAAATPTAGAFAPNSTVNLTQTTVTSILNQNQFTVSAVPTIPLVNATVIASYWLPGQWNSRRVKITSSLANYVEASCTGNNHNTLVVAISTPVHGASGYTILQQPTRSLGTNLMWNFGASDLNTRGVYLYQARGGPSLPGLPGFDRLNLKTDQWDFLMPTPSYEGITTGSMYAYDGADRIYFTTQASQRVYYLDLTIMTIHGASQYPYAAGAVIPGNRMEIFETADGLKYLWLNRHTGQECFKQLLFY